MGDNILAEPAFLIGFIVLLGYALLEKRWYEILAGFLKATVGFFILSAGAEGLVNNFEPITIGLKDQFNLDVMVIDPYFGQNAIAEGLYPVFGRLFSDVMLLLLFAFIVNLLLVKFNKYTKLRVVFTTGNVQIHQAATAFWILLFTYPFFDRWLILAVGSVILGLYWAVGANLTVEITQDLTNGAGFAVAHQQMFGISLFAKLAEKFRRKNNNEGSFKRIEELEFPGFLSIFKENIVATSILMLIFFGGILGSIGKPYLINNEFIAADDNFFFYILEISLHFAVYLAILQLGVRIFVNELTESFQGISKKWLQNAVPGIDVAAIFSYGSSNALTIGFLFGALGQFLMISLLFLLKAPILIIPGFLPLFFDNAAIAVFANNRGGLKPAIIFPFISGMIQVGGSALFAGWIGLSSYGGYLGMFDWVTVWPIITIILKFFGMFGILIILIILIVIPQLQYHKNPNDYFLVIDDYETYKKNNKTNDLE